MIRNRIAFAVPGDITNLTGGTIYDRRVIEALPAHGIDVEHIALPGSFPTPPPEEMDVAFARLAEVPSDVPLIVDGLAFGALDPDRVARLQSPITALVHHPLAEETGLAEETRTHLFQTERANLLHARQVLVPSRHTATLLTEAYGVSKRKITVARPGTDQPTLTPDPIDPPLILAVGIQSPRKGHDVLIQALAGIKDLDWQATIVGAPLDSPYAATLEVLRKQAGLEWRVALAGRVKQRDLQRYYAQATAFALATRYEGYGIVFDEALTHGLPVVSCATGAVPDTVPERAGLLVPPDAPQEFAEALREMLTNHRFRTSCAEAAKMAGRCLPSWSDTARIIADALASPAICE